MLSNAFSKDLNIHKHPAPQNLIPERDDSLGGRRQSANQDSELGLNSVLTGAWRFVS